MKKTLLILVTGLIAVFYSCAPYNYYVSVNEMKNADGVGIITYQQSGFWKNKTFKRSVLMDELAQNSVQIFSKKGFDVKIVNMNFFNLRSKYPELEGLISKKMEAQSEVDFDKLLDMRIEKVSGFDYDVHIKKDLNRVKEELGLRYLVILANYEINPGVYKVIAIDLVNYNYVFSLNMKSKKEFFWGLKKLFNPTAEIEKMRADLTTIVDLLKKKAAN